MLAAAGPKGLRREQILAVLWPDSQAERGRHALSQTLYNLRRDLGREVVVATPSDLRFDPSQIQTDLDAFRTALAAEDWTTAAELYRGPFLPGFSLGGEAPDFDRWVDQERVSLARLGHKAIEMAAQRMTRDRGKAASIPYWERLTSADPLSARFCLGLMEALTAAGDTGRALAHAQTHADLVRQELQSEVDQSVARFAEQLRRENQSVVSQSGRTLTTVAAVAPPEKAAPLPPSVTLPASPAATALSASRWNGRLATGVLVAIIALFAGRALLSREVKRPVLAIGEIRTVAGVDSSFSDNVLGALLATSLGRVVGLDIISPTRMYELLPANPDSSRDAWSVSARRAGAQEIIEGEFARVGGQLRIDLRRIDLASGRIERGYRAIGADPYLLIDSVAVAVSQDLGFKAPGGRGAELGTHSPVAIRQYQEGLQAYYHYDVDAANRLFGTALEADTTFAMAAYYVWLTSPEEPGRVAQARRALRLAADAPDRDRWVVQSDIGNGYHDPAVLPLADSLVARFPDDPTGLLQAANLRIGHQSIDRVAPLLERAIAIDSIAGGGRNGDCRLCRSLWALAHAYWVVDSVQARERTLRRWIRLAPTDPNSWATLMDYLRDSGREADAALARAKATEFGWRSADPVRDDQRVATVLLDPVGIEKGCATLALPKIPSSTWTDRRWHCLIGLRALGRYREALLLSQNRFRGIVRPDVGVDSLTSTLLDWARGRSRLAAATFGRTAAAFRNDPDLFPGRAARSLVWNLTLAASASLTGGDTASARSLVDSIETIGRRSGEPGDPLLHHYVRGGLALAAGRTEEANDQFRVASFSWVAGYTRINYDYAGALIAAKRASEAIPLLEAALRGPVDAGNLYITRTELHQRLAEALDAAGQVGAAAASYRLVERAWREGDPTVRDKHEQAVRWLGQHGQPLAK